MRTPHYDLVEIGGRAVLLSRRFNRDGAALIPFLSALSMMGLKDGERGSYPEFVDLLSRYDADAPADAAELYRCMAFNVLVSNVNDHLRNHGFLWSGGGGWRLSPAYDLNRTPTDVRPRILTTNIDVDEGTCDLTLVLEVAGFFGLSAAAAHAAVGQVARAVAGGFRAAEARGARAAEIRRMSSAFEHADLERALRH